MEKLHRRWAVDTVFINWATCLKKLRMHGLLILRYQTKMLEAVLATYLLYRCKPLCMLIFRVVTYPRLKL